MPRVSIVIPARNAERFLGATLDSVLAQTHAEWTCVVVDDDSDDATLAVAERYATLDPRVSALHVKGGGVSAARNAGFRASDEQAEYCTFMDSDDVWVPTALAALLERAEGDPGAIGAHGLADFIDEAGQPLRPGEFAARGRRRLALVGRRPTELAVEAPTDFAVLVLGPTVFPPGVVLARRAAYLEAGPFDETLVAGEDWDLLVRLSRVGYLAFLPEVIVFYRRHDANLGATAQAPRQVHLAQCQIYHSPLNSSEQRQMARRAWRAAQRARLAELAQGLRQNGVGQPAAGARLVLQGAVVSLRWARGYPRPAVRRPRLRW